jgi:uncharacterized circularly permuted ATP-grasp superfamily protein/uncharacterized alpha-E superfamily protein
MTVEAQLELDISATDGSKAALARMLGTYSATRGVHDELIDQTGAIRPHWRGFLSDLAGLGTKGIARACLNADRHLADNGVVYRVYDDEEGRERPWPLSHLPLLLTSADWQELSAGIVQRAELIDRILTDLHGEAKLVKGGHLPAALVAGNPEFLRPAAGISPPGGRQLWVYAADISRGPDGRWWVMADRTQAPSGLGYAVENRIALSRALPDLFEDMSVLRLAGFIQALRASLAAATGRDDPRMALLTPGPANETFFEHAYLARVLGCPLVEGADLSVIDDMLYLRDIEGARRLDVLIRRVDGGFMDPLELDTRSRLGVPGLMQAVRSGNTLIANALGSGLAEAPALRAFLAPLCRTVLGEDLKLPSLATWWLGGETERTEVMANLNRYALAPAFGRSLPGVIDNMGIDGWALSREERARLTELIARRPMDFVGQEPVRLGTLPAFEDGRLAARPFALRVFAVAGPDGWTVMPGGLCRISERSDARSLSMQRGGRSADVWVLSDGPVEPAYILPEPDKIEPTRASSGLPARAADNLFWLGRYLERLEATLRAVRNLAGRSGDDDPDLGGDPSARRVADLLAAWGAVPFKAKRLPATAREALIQKLPGSVPSLIADVRRTAASVRDRLSPDAWRTLADLSRVVEDARDDDSLADTFQTAEEALRLVAAFFGLTHETMYRRAGWRFLDLGARIERAISVSRFARRLTALGEDDKPGGSAQNLDRLLELTDTRVVYRARYLAGLAIRPVIDLVLLDDANPRSVAFQVERILEHLVLIAGRREGDRHDTVEKPALRLLADLETGEAADFDEARIEMVEAGLMAISDAVTRRWFAEATPESDDAVPAGAAADAAEPAEAIDA